MRSLLYVLPYAGIVAAAALQKGLGAGISYLGRVNPATLELSWPSTGVAFGFTGTTATIGVANITGTNSVDLYIDGLNPIDIPTVAGDIVVPVLPYGSHTIMLRKRSEAVYGSIFLGSITTDGIFNTGKNAYTLPSRQIEVIGDSISVGYGVDGVFPCVNTAALEDNPMTYEAVASQLLQADYSVVAWSGKGLTRNYVTAGIDTSPLMPELWTRYGANDADASYTFPARWNPQAVVIALGTNDFSYLLFNASGDPYNGRPAVNSTVLTNTLVTFIRQVHKHYKDATFFIVSSPLLSDTYPTAADMQHTTLNNADMAAVKAVGLLGIKAEFVNWPLQGNQYGCDYHPDALTHAQQGEVLASVIGEALGW